MNKYELVLYMCNVKYKFENNFQGSYFFNFHAIILPSERSEEKGKQAP